MAPENEAMIAKLRAALAEGRPISDGDASFYFHELHESTLMGQGVEYDEAHAAAIAKYGVSPYSIYPPDVINAFPDVFNNNWFAFWGING